MRLGYFDEHSREYVITDPRHAGQVDQLTARASLRLVDHTGGRSSARMTPPSTVITKYIQQMPAQTSKARRLYCVSMHLIQDQYQLCLFSPFFVPSLDAFQRLNSGLVRQPASSLNSITCVHDATIFVPLDGPASCGVKSPISAVRRLG